MPEEPAHPRSRGENDARYTCVNSDYGSSPLTRGKRVYKAGTLYVDGLIPAHAGKTSKDSPGPLPAPAHPRSRGENPDRANSGVLSGGSSPLTRGKRVDDLFPEVTIGLIPAHAGKTAPTLKPGSISPAHPRSRGENLRARRLGACDPGSSPLTRGKRGEVLARLDAGRLIPAHAGKT